MGQYTRLKFICLFVYNCYIDKYSETTSENFEDDLKSTSDEGEAL